MSSASQVAHPGIGVGEIERGEHDADSDAALEAPGEDAQKAQDQQCVLGARHLVPGVHQPVQQNLDSKVRQ